MTEPTAPARSGTLTVYLGAAPGVGKTYAMLDEAHRRLARGTDVVVGLVETHGRPLTTQHLEGLEVLPRRTIRYRDTEFTEMDTDAVIARKPAVVLVDELAHTNVPGSRHEKRAADVAEIRAAGIDVITTVNIQHLESLNDEVERITGVKQRETVPDEVVRAADQIQLVDMSPQALRRRMAHGNIYRAEQVDASLSSYFRVGQPDRAPRAGAAVGGGPGRRRARRVPQGPPDRPPVADQGADRGRGDRRQRERDPAATRRAAWPSEPPDRS